MNLIAINFVKSNRGGSFRDAIVHSRGFSVVDCLFRLT